jgi:hypothetical protein
VRTWLIEVPDPAAAPVTFDWATVQLKLVPVTLLVRAILVREPVQSVCDIGFAVAVGV